MEMQTTELIESIPTKVLSKREVEITILTEGPGNKQRKCWYGIEAIESGVAIFRGAQVYANHPSKSQMQDLPERDVKELVGRIKETWVAADPKSGKKQLKGILKVMEGDQYDWALSLMHESIQAQKEGFPPVAQVSIHADGDVEKRLVEGEQYNYVKNIKSAVSVDVVTKGGIKTAGFDKFVESLNGGSKMTNEERLGLIQKKLSEALTAEDQAFLEAQEKEAEGTQDLQESDDEFEQVFATENGFQTADGTPVEDSEVMGVDEQENVYGPEQLAQMGADAEAGVFEQEEEEEVEDPQHFSNVAEREMRASGNEDEVPISEMATRFPHLANEIDREEMGTMESDRDPEIVKLKFENKLLMSRAVAERKILESQLPEGFIIIDELLGKPPEDMDRIIESKHAMWGNMCSLVESSRPATVQASQVRESDNKPNLGRRWLDASVLPTY